MTKTITSVTTDDGGRSPTVGQKTDGADRHRGAFSPDTGWAWVVAIGKTAAYSPFAHAITVEFQTSLILKMINFRSVILKS